MQSIIKLKQVIRVAFLFSTVLLTHLSYATGNSSDISGIWHSIDDKTGLEKSIIRINKTTNNTYGGTVLKVFAQPGYKPEENCIDCPAPFTNKPIAGLNILWGLQTDSNDNSVYTNGKILDPLSGHIYRAKIKISPDGKLLNVRGFIGFSLLGRSQIWKREE